MDKNARIGFVGLGMMGKPMSKRVLTGGYALTVHDIRSDPVEELVKVGARKASSLKDLVETSDIVITSLPTAAACEEVYFGESGLLTSVRAGQVLVETSTVSPNAVRRAAEAAAKKGAGVVDAALLSRTDFHPGLSKLKSNEIVDRGQVTVMVGGQASHVAKVKPVLTTFGNPIFEIGPVGSGVMIKVLNAAMTHAYFAVACEVFAVAAKAGIDIKKLEEIFRNTSAKSPALNNNMVYYLQNGTGKMMSIEAALKDSDAMLELARETNIPALMQSVNHAYYEMALHRGGARELPWDGELMKMWEGFVGKALRFDQ